MFVDFPNLLQETGNVQKSLAGRPNRCYLICVDC